MLVSDLEEVAGKRDQYKKCANLLEAVQQLMEYFQQYETIPKVCLLTFPASAPTFHHTPPYELHQVKNLSRRLAQLQAQLQAAVLDDFKILMGQVWVECVDGR